jgi:hypothetical protein
VSLLVAEAVARVGFGEGFASGPAPADLRAHLRSAAYDPAYPSYLEDHARGPGGRGAP